LWGEGIREKGGKREKNKFPGYHQGKGEITWAGNGPLLQNRGKISEVKDQWKERLSTGAWGIQGGEVFCGASNVLLGDINRGKILLGKKNSFLRIGDNREGSDRSRSGRDIMKGSGESTYLAEPARGGIPHVRESWGIYVFRELQA